MTYKGKVKDGMVVLEPGASLPDGTDVEVQPIGPCAGALGDRLMKYAGKVTGLPSDMAENHDRYIHGQPEPGRAASPTHFTTLHF